MATNCLLISPSYKINLFLVFIADISCYGWYKLIRLPSFIWIFTIIKLKICNVSCSHSNSHSVGPCKNHCPIQSPFIVPFLLLSLVFLHCFTKVLFLIFSLFQVYSLNHSVSKCPENPFCQYFFFSFAVPFQVFLDVLKPLVCLFFLKNI